MLVFLLLVRFVWESIPQTRGLGRQPPQTGVTAPQVAREGGLGT